MDIMLKFDDDARIRITFFTIRIVAQVHLIALHEVLLPLLILNTESDSHSRQSFCC